MHILFSSRFVPYKGEKTGYIYIDTTAGGCSSPLGMRSSSYNHVEFGQYCSWGNLCHEFMHSLGEWGFLAPTSRKIKRGCFCHFCRILPWAHKDRQGQVCFSQVGKHPKGLETQLLQVWPERPKVRWPQGCLWLWINHALRKISAR